MPRGAQVIYPKDLAPICMLADIGPGLRVFESGVGSGALSMTMLRWGADIVGYELREDFANRARSNVRSFLGEDALERYRVELRDSYEGIDDGPYDRVVLDLPEPWRVVPHAEKVLHAGGILIAYTPSIIQASQAREALKGLWIDARTIEVLHRGWHIDGLAVRPDHRMVAHTGFLTVARYLGARGRDRDPPGPLSGRSGLDVDALAGALLGGLDHGVELAVGDVGETFGALRVALRRGVHRGALLDVGQPVVEQGEHVRADLLAEPVAGAEVLVDPDLHRVVPFVSGRTALDFTR